MPKRIKPYKIRVRNPEQITISESLFKQTGSRLNSYVNVEKLLRRLERGLRLKQHHLSFVDARKIFDIESGLLELVELVENG